MPNRQRDLIDLANETADRETGRAQRFHTGSTAALDAKRERDKEQAFNELLRRLQNPEYAKLYNEARNILNDAGRAVDAALLKNANESDQVQRRLQDMRDSAATLADGRKVFRGENGRLIAEDGTDVTDQRASITGLSDATPLWPDYAQDKERVEALAREREEIERYRREKLDPAKGRLDDPDNPYSPEELQEIIEHTQDEMVEPVRAQFDELRAAAPKPAARVSDSAADEFLGSYELGTPDMNGHFKTAKAGEPHASPETPLPANTPKLS